MWLTSFPDRATTRVYIVWPTQMLTRDLFCARLSDVFSSGQWADLLQFDHQLNVLHREPGVVSGDIPARRWRCGTDDIAIAVPPSSTLLLRTFASCEYVVVHVNCRKFHPVMLYNPRMKWADEHVVDRTGNTTHNIDGYVRTFRSNVQNSNGTVKS